MQISNEYGNEAKIELAQGRSGDVKFVDILIDGVSYGQIILSDAGEILVYNENSDELELGIKD